MKRKKGRLRFEGMDAILLFVLGLWALAILIPFINVVAISFSTQKSYVDTPLLLWPYDFTLESYQMLFQDGRIWIGYRTSLQILMMALPLNMLLTTSMAYGLSRRSFPGKKLLMRLILFTMLFHGGIIPLYLTLKSYGIMGSLWSVVLASGLNTFYMIIMLNFFSALPESLVESARLDGAGEWKILFRIILPLSKPVLATVLLYYLVDRWNEWYNAMIFIRDANKTPLQLVLRSIVLESQTLDNVVSETMDVYSFSMGIKMAAIIVTIVPVMCIYPFLQKYFAKGVMVGAVKA